MTIQWMTETTFLLPWLSKFQGYKLIAENAAKWIEDYYASPEGQQSLVDRKISLTPELKAEDTVRDLTMLIDALRVPISQLTLFGYNVTHVVFSMDPYVPNYITVIDLAKYTTHDYHTPYPFGGNDPENPSVWERVVGFSWYEFDPMLPWGAKVVVALLLDERRNLHTPENMTTNSYAYELLAASNPNLKVTFRQDHPDHPTPTQVLLWDMNDASTFIEALEALKPRIDSLTTILAAQARPFFRSDDYDLTQNGMWWIIQPDLEDNARRPALHERTTAWSCSYAPTVEERAVLGYCRLTASLLRHNNYNVAETLRDWLTRGNLDVLSLQLLSQDIAGQFPEYSDAAVMRFILDYHTHLTPLHECLMRLFQYRYGQPAEPSAFQGYDSLLWTEFLMLLHNLGLIDVLGFTRIADPPMPLEDIGLDLTGFYEHDEDDLFAPTMMVHHAGRFLEGKLVLRFGNFADIERFAIYTFTANNIAKAPNLGGQATISCELSGESDAESTGLASSFTADCVVTLDSGDGAILIELTIPSINQTYRMAKSSRIAYLDAEEIYGQFPTDLDDQAALVMHRVTPNQAERLSALMTADQLALFIHYALIEVLYDPPNESGHSTALDSAVDAWNNARDIMNPFVTFAADGITMNGQSQQFPWFQSIVRRTLQATMLSVGTTPVSAWYKLIDKIRLPTLIYDLVRPTFDHLDELLGITDADLEMFPSTTPNVYDWEMYGLSVSRGWGKLFSGINPKASKWLTRGFGLGFYPVAISEQNPPDAAQGLWPAYYYGISYGLDARLEVNTPVQAPPTTLKYSNPSTKHLNTHYHWTPNEFFNITTVEFTTDIRFLVKEYALGKMGVALFFGHPQEIAWTFNWPKLVSTAETTRQRIGYRNRFKSETIFLLPSWGDTAPMIGTATPNLPDYLGFLTNDDVLTLTVSFADGETILSSSAKQTVRTFVAKHRLAFATTTMLMEITGYGAFSEPITTGAQRAQAVYDYFYCLLGDYLTIWTQNTILVIGDITSQSAVERTVTVRLAQTIRPILPTEAN